MNTRPIPIPAWLRAGLFSLLATPFALASLPVIPPGETVVFSDDFEDNRAAWSFVSVVNGAGDPAPMRARIADSTWSPSQPGTSSIKSSVESVHALATPIKVVEGPVSIYMSVRVNAPKGGDGSRFSVNLQEAGKGSFVGLVIRPGVNGFLHYRNEEGKAVSAKLGGSVFANPNYFYQFKLTVSAAWNVNGSIGRAEAFFYDDETQKYVSLGTVDESIAFKTGLLSDLIIQNRNGDDGAAAFDSVVVTQAPH